jgi:PAS domain-containing protein
MKPNLIMHFNKDFELLIEQGKYYKFIWNIETGYNKCIAPLNNFFTYTHSDIENTPNFLLKIIDENDLVKVEKLIENVKSNTNSKIQVELSINDATENKKWIKLLAYLHFDENKNAILNCLIEDKTEQNEIKEALLKSEIEKTQILDSMVDGAVYVSPDLKIKYANKTFIEKHPLYKDNLEGQLCYKVIHNMDNPCITCSVQKVLKTKIFQKTIRSVKNGSSGIQLLNTAA